jgi:Flp pilus assembly protein TadG
VAPVILVITAGIVDFGLLATKAAALAGATRIGGEYARLHPADTAGIQNAMQNSMSFTPPLTFPASFPQACECDDQTFIACTDSCPAGGRAGPNAFSSGSEQIRLPPRWCRGREFPGL